ncbi:prepilin peptidase [Falsiroseomonas sp. CW058]|uniref:prepilin peptidase n=1 Tax=Falsiroseomonas sp. CW058 TaxID=3388664 RepID=UPI003D314CE3
MTGSILLLLLAAAWRDLLVRLIPDILPLGILLSAAALRGLEGVAPLLASLGGAAVLFLLLFLPALRGWLGGGDVKLASALAVALSPAALPDLVAATAAAGGVLGVAYLAGPRLAGPLARLAARVPHRLGRGMAAEARRLRRGGPVPYGIAIAAGGVALLAPGLLP